MDHTLVTVLTLSPWRSALLALVPLLYAGAAVAALVGNADTDTDSDTRLHTATRWRIARIAAALALGLAGLSLLGLLAAGPALVRGPALLALGDAGVLHTSLRSDALGAVMLLLVSFIGWVIVAYSQPYLAGARGQPRYVRSLMLTLAAVTVLVTTNNLAVLALAWVATSLALHGLLTFFSARPQALIAAHKKFIASRVADLCLLGGVALIGHVLGTLEIDQAIASAHALATLPAPLPTPLRLAALLLAVGALLKCAQLPAHGWLIQVMEAPTPVSALLHAGVVNLGGFLLLRVGGLVADVPLAQALLVVVGSVTAVVAALVMMTRISIKVALAWSTCAQMGFMLMQCGLGLHDLALLHLVAHSLYKAHAFLAAGGAVEQNCLQQMMPPQSRPPLGAAGWGLGALVGMALVAAAAWAWGFSPAAAPALWALGGVLALAQVPLLTGPLLRTGVLGALAGLGAAFAVALVYFGLHAAFSAWLGHAAAAAPPGPALVGWVLGCFGALFVVQGAVRTRPQGALARWLYPRLFAGLYLDEWFTRLTFRLWPARVPAMPGALTPRTVPQASVQTPA